MRLSPEQKQRHVFFLIRSFGQPRASSLPPQPAGGRQCSKKRSSKSHAPHQAGRHRRGRAMSHRAGPHAAGPRVEKAAQLALQRLAGRQTVIGDLQQQRQRCVIEALVQHHQRAMHAGLTEVCRIFAQADVIEPGDDTLVSPQEDVCKEEETGIGGEKGRREGRKGKEGITLLSNKLKIQEKKLSEPANARTVL